MVEHGLLQNCLLLAGNFELIFLSVVMTNLEV